MHAELAAAEGAGEEASALLRRALEEGYLRALRLSRGDTDAQCGVAEVKLAMARAAAAAADAPAAARLAAEAADAYAAALAKPEQLGSVADRAEVHYNFACAAANCGEPPACLRARAMRCASDAPGAPRTQLLIRARRAAGGGGRGAANAAGVRAGAAG